MKVNNSIYLFILAGFVACTNPKTNSQEEASEKQEITSEQEINVTKLWETDTLLLASESVLYHSPSEVLFVACINGVSTDKDGNGFIAQVNLDGQIVNEKWATDLDAPKGMGIYEDKLYVTNITQLVEIDLSSGEVTNRWEVEGSGFLNDITIGREGGVYFTDSSTDKIHLLKNGGISTWLEGTEVTGLNGLLAEEDGLMLASMGSSNFARIDWDTKTVEVKTDSIGAGDGIASDGNGNYIVSSWAGEVFYIDGSTWKKSSILSTQADTIQSADITYIPEKSLLLVPTFFTNTVTAYKVEID